MQSKIKTMRLFALAFIAPAFAEIPLTIEDLTTDKNRFKLHGNISYFNQSERQLV